MADLAGCVNRMQVNWLYLTSSVASVLRPIDVPGLETLVVGGEAVHQHVIETWAESGVSLINAYGYVIKLCHHNQDQSPGSKNAVLS